MSTNLIKVADASNLYRDPYSKGIVNSDVSALNKYKEARKRINSIELISAEQTKLKQDVAEIKDLLYKLLEQTNK